MHKWAGMPRTSSNNRDFKYTHIKYVWKETFYKGKEELKENIIFLVSKQCHSEISMKQKCLEAEECDR